MTGFLLLISEVAFCGIVLSLLLIVTAVKQDSIFRTEASTGTIYYISTSGSDSNDGKSPQTPFATIQQCASVAIAGDSCVIRGGAYRETVKPAASGTQDNPITFVPYQNEKVTIDGSDPITGWSLYQGNIYKARVTLPITGYSDKNFFANQLFEDGQMMIEARWPNTGLDLLTPTFATAQNGTLYSTNSASLLVDSALTQPDGYWNGATLFLLGGYKWIAQSGTVTESTVGQLKVQGANGAYKRISFTPNSSYYLTGTLKALDAPGEWFYDGTYLYFWPKASDDPSQHQITAKQRNYAFDLSGKSFINISNINIFSATILTDKTSTDNHIDRLAGKYVSHFVTIPGSTYPSAPYSAHTLDSGIIMNGKNNVLENSVIQYSAGNGVSLQGDSNIVRKNTVSDVDYAAIYNANILAYGTNMTVEHNTLYNSGRYGISVSGLPDPTANTNSVFDFYSTYKISGNDIYQFGLITLDLGGINVCCRVDGKGSVIDHNVVHDSKVKKNDPSGGYTSAGIYLDHGSGNTLIHHNVVWNDVGDGIRLNPGAQSGQLRYSQDNLVYNNTVGTGQDRGIASISSTLQDASGTQIINNISFETIDAMPNAVITNNLLTPTPFDFTNLAGNLYTLKPTSQAIDKGQVITGITDEYTGNAPDVGAYEYGTQAWNAGAQPVTSPTPYPPTGTPAATNAPTPTPAPSLQHQRTRQHRYRLRRHQT